jgi:hypothetical protein
MMFLIRTAFWLMILVLLLPTDERQQSDVFGTAEAAVKDVSGFCGRNPGVCEKGKDAFDVFVHKAEFGARMLMSFISEQSGSTSEAAAPVAESATAPASASWAEEPAQESGAPAAVMDSQDTLNPKDLEPAWGLPRHAG